MNKQEYVSLGIRLCKELVELVPIISHTDHYEGRENAKAIEKDWISRVHSTFNFEGETAKVLTPERDDRFWTDFAIIYKEEFFPFNFKSGVGGTKDNISGLKYLRYLIFYDLDKEYNLKSITEEKLAKDIIKLKKGEISFNETNRDYFCVAYNIRSGNIKIIPISCIKSEDLATNPKNLFQADFHNADFEINRTLRESVDFIIEKFIEYNKKRAKPYLSFREAGIVSYG
ncbi:hypothetical protein A3K73_04040 [Candidatus Pacearchaeota archaeon RBG_13_36_9]|nr:MAG: hypothetical protein A3K73_04040 [Candidatus Pacearchaeota archaeon RBG_13_36_9]